MVRRIDYQKLISQIIFQSRMDISSFRQTFFNEKSLEDLRLRTLVQAKPSKALLEALKHQTAQNRNLKEFLKQKQKENGILKGTIQELTSEIKTLRSFLQKAQSLESFEHGQRFNLLQRKLQKSYEKQEELTVKLSLLHNENKILQREVLLLKEKLKKFNESGMNGKSSHFSGTGNHLSKEENAFITGVSGNESKELNQSSTFNYKIPSDSKQSGLEQREQQRVIGQNQRQQIQSQQNDSLVESAKFNQYVNFEDYDGGQKATTKKPPDNLVSQSQQSKVQVDIPLTESRQHYISGQPLEGVESESLYLRRMLSLPRSTTEHQDQIGQLGQWDQQEQKDRPHITEIVSGPLKETGCPAEETVQHNQSKFLVFANGTDKDIKLEIGTSLNMKGQPQDSQYTFLNLETNKSIQNQNAVEDISEKSLKYLKRSVKSSQPNTQKHISLKVCTNIGSKTHQNDIGLENMSNCDYEGLLEDIYKGSDEVYVCSGGDRNSMSNNSINQQFHMKRTVSQILKAEDLSRLMNNVKKQQLRHQKVNKPPILAHHGYSQPVNHYMPVTESYKTIDLEKSHNAIDRIDEVGEENNESIKTIVLDKNQTISLQYSDDSFIRVREIKKDNELSETILYPRKTEKNQELSLSQSKLNCSQLGNSQLGSSQLGSSQQKMKNMKIASNSRLLMYSNKRQGRSPTFSEKPESSQESENQGKVNKNEKDYRDTSMEIERKDQ